MIEDKVDRAKLDVAAILVTLLEVGDVPTPESSIYLAMRMEHGRYQTVRHVLVQGGLVTCKNSVMRLTAKGRTTAQMLKPIYDAAKQEKLTVD